MKRDNEYLREMLIGFEDADDQYIMAAEYIRMPPEEAKRLYHIRLASDAGLVVETGSSVYRLTNQGHDYIAAIRDEGVWQQTRAVVADTGGEITLDLMKKLAVGFLKTKIEKHTGVALE
ncbi:MAG: DUF2513 domain-containing protein [Rhodobacteraceae bacterium]|nr:DUF2513 domain-containing protein [Paracoccaceae bacterium]